jgi:ABC-2 type transport system permease protein
MKTPRPPLIECGAASAAVQRFLRYIGLDPHQFVLFLRLLRTLSERGEFMGNLGVDRFALSLMTALAAVFFGVPMGLLALAQLPAAVFLLVNLSAVSCLLLLLILPEAANTLFNPVEISVLAHQPVDPPTFVAAKITHVLVIVCYLVPALTLPPALCGLMLKEARWMYPLTHLAAGLLAGLFVAFLVCASYGWLFRFVPASRLKSVTLWLQILVFGSLPAMGALIGAAVKSLRNLNLVLAGWSWLPLVWFVAIGLLGSRGAPPSMSWQGLLAIVLTAAVIWLGLRSFSGTYLQETAGMIRGPSRLGEARTRRNAILPAVRFITGSPAGMAAFSFTSKLMMRDWQFRRAAFPMVLYLALMFASFFKKGEVLVSPLVHGGFSIAHLFPHFLGLMLATPCAVISFGEFHQGSWIFVTAPLDSLRAFTRGVYLSLWFPGALLPHLLILPMLTWLWGWKAAVLFACFSLILVSFYLALELLLIPGLPFSSPYKASRSMIGLPVVLLGIMIAAILVAVQWLVFQIWWVAIVAGSLFGLGTWLTVHFTLRRLEGEIRQNLRLLQIGPTQLFKEID